MKITATQFISLDGVSQGPGAADEDVSDGFRLGGWFSPHLDDAFVQRASAWLDLADGLLLGRRTYEAFARDWPQITDPDDPFTERMNTLPKYVVSNTLTTGDWSPTTVLRGDPRESVAPLKADSGRELQIHGSARLVGTLLPTGLVDVLRLAIAPVVVGSGRRLITHPTNATGLRLVGNDVTPGGLVLLEYEVTDHAALGDYQGVTALSTTRETKRGSPG